jgi:hypothetical protein
MDKMGPELRQINWDHHPKSRDKHNDDNPLRLWLKIADWAARGKVGGLIDELPNVRLVHSGCHTHDHK